MPSPGWNRAVCLALGDGSLCWEAFLALQIAQGTVTALSNISCKGVDEELAGVLWAETPKPVEQKLFGVQEERGGIYSRCLHLPNHIFMLLVDEYICIKRQ